MAKEEDEQGGRRRAADVDRPYPAIPPGRINLDVARVREELVSCSVAIALHLQSSHHPLPLLPCYTARHGAAPQAKQVGVLSPHLPQHSVH